MHDTLYENIQRGAVDVLRSIEKDVEKRTRFIWHRWMYGLPIRFGQEASTVNWFEVTITSETGKRI